jgi:hypothetical protein
MDNTALIGFLVAVPLYAVRANRDWSSRGCRVQFWEVTWLYTPALGLSALSRLLPCHALLVAYKAIIGLRSGRASEVRVR